MKKQEKKKQDKQGEKDDNKPNYILKELKAEVSKRVIQHIWPVECKLIPHLVPQPDGKTYYVNIKLICKNDKDDSKWNKTKISVMRWEKPLIKLFKVELGIEVIGVGIS